MKVLEKDGNNYYLTIVPRFYVNDNIKLSIREAMQNDVMEFTTDAELIGGLISIDLKAFIPKPDVKYTVTATDEENNLFWTGQVLYTTKDKQDYTLSMSTQNKLKF